MQTQSLATKTFGNRANLWRKTGIVDPERQTAKPSRDVQFNDDNLHHFHGYAPEFYRKAMKSRKARELAAEREAKLAAIKAAKDAELKALAKIRAFKAYRVALENKTAVNDYLAKTVEPCPFPAIEPKDQRISVADIILHTAAHFNVSVEFIKSASRKEIHVMPRQIAIFIAHSGKGQILHGHRSTLALGRHFGGRDHTTILHAVRKIKALRQTDETVAQSILVICHRLGMSVD